MVNEAYKRCPRCGDEKPLDEFNRDRHSCDGRRSVCKFCSRAYYRANKDQILAQKRVYEKAHKDKITEKNRAYYARNKDEIAEEKRAYGKAHKAQIARRNRAYRATHKDDIAEKKRAYYEANKDKILVRDRDRRKRHRQKVQARDACRRAVRQGRLTKPDCCEDCGEATKPRRLHGHHEDYSQPLDVEWLCLSCHGKRHRAET